MMNNEIQLVGDGDGVALFGEPSAMNHFLTSQGLSSAGMDMRRLSSSLATGAAASHAASGIATMSGRWVKLTEESAKALKAGTAMKGSTDGVSRAVLTEQGGIKQILEFSNRHGDLLANPVVLAGAAGLMAQLAMQQTMDEITDYLASIDEKVEDVLRAQTDAVLADMVAAGLLIDEAMTIRSEVGRVSEVTWSKVQSVAFTVTRTQAYALRQLQMIAEKLESEKKISDLARVAKDAQATVKEWTAVLARCYQLRDGIAVLELDRVLDSAPDEVDNHRHALKVSRRERNERISNCAGTLVLRIDEAAVRANAKVLLNPTAAPSVVESRNQVISTICEFEGVLGIDHDQALLEARPWGRAASDARIRVLEMGTERFDAARQGVGSARRFGAERAGRARSATAGFSSRVADRARHRRDPELDDAGDSTP